MLRGRTRHPGRRLERHLLGERARLGWIADERMCSLSKLLRLKIFATLIALLAFSAGLLPLKGWAATSRTRDLADALGLTQVQVLTYRGLMLVDSTRVPADLRPYLRVPLKGTTPLLFELRRVLDKIPPEEREILQTLYDRPPSSVLPLSVVSPSGHFRVHYTLDGRNAVQPDYPDTVAAIFDHCWQVEVDTLKFRAPPSDGGKDGPEYDVYVLDISDYGYTTAEEEVPSTPRDDWVTYIVVDNDYQNPRYHTKGLNGLRVTAAHEFFHAIHFGYRSFLDEDVFYYEASGVWMEDFVYDDVNDYYQYLPSFFGRPEKPFNTYDGWHEYGLAIWNKMLVRLFGRDVMRQIWEQMIAGPRHVTPAIEAMDQVAQRHGDTFRRLLAEFQTWNYFTGKRADPEHYYKEGAAYPLLRPTRDVLLDSSYVARDSARALSGVFEHFEVQKSNAFRAALTFDTPAAWMIGVAVWDPEGQHWHQTLRPGQEADLGFLNTYTDFLIVPVNVSQNGAESRRRFQLEVSTRPSDYRPTFEVEDPTPNPFMPARHGVLEWCYRLAEPVDRAFFYVLDEHGRVLVKQDLGAKGDGFHTCRWNGRNDRGEPVASGVYLLELVAGKQVGKAKVAVLR